MAFVRFAMEHHQKFRPMKKRLLLFQADKFGRLLSLTAPGRQNYFLPGEVRETFDGRPTAKRSLSSVIGAIILLSVCMTSPIDQCTLLKPALTRIFLPHGLM